MKGEFSSCAKTYIHLLICEKPGHKRGGSSSSGKNATIRIRSPYDVDLFESVKKGMVDGRTAAAILKCPSDLCMSLLDTVGMAMPLPCFVW